MANSAQVCILGGGFGGLFTALYLNSYRWAGKTKPQITLIDQGDRFLFTPLLYELITEELQPWEIAPSFDRLLANTGIRFLRDKVQQVDLRTRQVQLQSGKLLPYDRLVLALGQEPMLDIVPGAANYAYSFRTLADVRQLKERLHQLELDCRHPIQVAIAGGGPNGVELACKLADRLGRRAQVRLIDRGDTLLRNFSRLSQKAACHALANRHVQIDLQTSIEAVEPKQIHLSHQGQNSSVPVDLLVWAIGTRSHRWLQTLGCAQTSAGQLVTHTTLQLRDYPEVFALGDLAAIQDANGQTVPATAQAAFQQAKTAAYNLQASLRKKPLKAFHYQHLGEMMTLGFNEAVVVGFGLYFTGHLAGTIRKWAYMFRMPTLKHRSRVVRHWLKHGWQQIWSFVLNQVPLRRKKAASLTTLEPETRAKQKINSRP
jgi:demethylphylloquinone reductase